MISLDFFPFSLFQECIKSLVFDCFMFSISVISVHSDLHHASRDVTSQCSFYKMNKWNKLKLVPFPWLKLFCWPHWSEITNSSTYMQNPLWSGPCSPLLSNYFLLPSLPVILFLIFRLLKCGSHTYKVCLFLFSSVLNLLTSKYPPSVC